MDDKSTVTILNALLPLFSYEVDSKKDLLIKFPIPRPFSSSPSLESKSSKMNSSSNSSPRPDWSTTSQAARRVDMRTRKASRGSNLFADLRTSSESMYF